MTLWPASETPARCAVAGHPGVMEQMTFPIDVCESTIAAPMPMDDDDEPCRCWTNIYAFRHDGHCCWNHPGDTFELGSLPPCGHWHPSVPRPEVTQ